MARGKKTGGRDFKPGEVANPSGRPKLPEDLKEAKKLNQIEVERIMNRLLNLKFAELTAELNSGNLTSKEAAIGTVIHMAIKKGDHSRLDFIFNRLIGKVKDHIEHSGPEGHPLPFSISSIDPLKLKEALKKIENDV